VSPIRLTGASIDTLAISRVAVAAPVNVTATSSATPGTVATIPAFSCEGGTYLVLVYAPFLTIGTTNLDVELWVDGAFQQSLSGHMAASIPRPGTTFGAPVALGNGNHALLVRAFVDAGTGVFGAGAGTTGVAPNAWAAVYPA
jgi:hypothetical protein